MSKLFSTKPLAAVVAAGLLQGSAQAVTATRRILALGDSLTDGYRISRNRAFPALLQSMLNKEGRRVEVINAGISGSTTASAMSRLERHLASPPDILILALGINDGLR